jgi:potassium efflux system protein
LVLLGLFSSLTLLVHWLPFSAQLRDANDSIFMLFLCLLTVPAINLRRMALARLENQVRNRYWLLAGQLASLLFPLGILVAGGLGLIGYINLAWTVARSLTWLVAVLAGWLVARGLLSDAVAWLKPYAMQHSARYGLLWTQDIIPLLHKLAKLGLLTLAALFLFKLNGWHTDSDFMRDILAYALFEIGQAEVTVQALLLSLFAVWIVGWLGKWSRQITYRWILSGIADLGVRHSLSVFTQYTVVLIGGVIVLRIIGLDLTTFTVFAGALGVGIGFGLQNITNNFISGLLLLIERPLRNGDLVELGNAKHGGEVTRIGIRSLTIKTWDNKEVIIPNSELISSAFTSWTHSDNILREELYLGVSYESDPAKVENILNRILADHPGVLKTPEPKVYFWEFADSALTFRYQYFVNLRETDRHEVKSSVLHHIWNDFKQAGVEIPFPQREVMVKASPELLGLLAAARRA